MNLACCVAYLVEQMQHAQRFLSFTQRPVLDRSPSHPSPFIYFSVQLALNSAKKNH